MARLKRGALWLTLAGCALLAGIWVHRYLLAASVFLRLEKAAEPGWLVHYGEREVSVREQAAGRLYLPSGGSYLHPILLVHGMHEEGIDDARMVGFARALAGAGFPVSTPRMDRLAHYQLDPAETRVIAEAARALARETHATRVFVFGISFGGGLAIRAACNDAPEIARIITLGAHHDAERVSRFYLGEPALDPAGQPALVEPHPYGRLALWMSLFGQRHQGTFNDDERAKVLAGIEAHREQLRQASPSSCPRLQVPLYLAHGIGDRVVPYTETLWNERSFSPARTLISPAIVHAEYDPPAFRERLQLIAFMVAALW